MRDFIDHTPECRATWLLGPTDLAAIRADEQLLGALAAGEVPDPSKPLGRLLAAFVREVEDGAAR